MLSEKTQVEILSSVQLKDHLINKIILDLNKEEHKTVNKILLFILTGYNQNIYIIDKKRLLELLKLYIIYGDVVVLDSFRGQERDLTPLETITYKKAQIQTYNHNIKIIEETISDIDFKMNKIKSINYESFIKIDSKANDESRIISLVSEKNELEKRLNVLKKSVQMIENSLKSEY